MAIVTAMLLVIFGMVFYFTRDNLEKQSIRAMEQAADTRVPRERPGNEPDKVMLPCFIVDINGSGRMEIYSNTFFDLSDENLIQELIRLTGDGKNKIGNLQEYKLRFQKITTPVGQRIVFVDISGEMETMDDLLKTCVLIGVVSLAAFFGISVALANWAVQPVEEAWNQQRQFVADASHELKTPLAVIMTNAELLQSREYAETERTRFADGILTMSRQMRGLVESLLELARMDGDKTKMDFIAVDFSELVNQSMLLFEPVYFEKGLLLESEAEEGLRVRGSQSHLRQVVDILLDNGSKYSAPGGTVQVNFRRQGTHCLLTVASPGEAISREDLTNIFKRFYRIDKARSRDGSYGLGLPIADSIVREHGGRIWAESAQGINTFFVRIPLMLV